MRNFDDHWCDAIERETAELAVAVAAMRHHYLGQNWAAMLHSRGTQSALPSAGIALDGWMENALMSEPATAIEDRYREILRPGPRPAMPPPAVRARRPASDGFSGRLRAEERQARDTSTGEQKALLIGLVLAHANIVGDDRYHAAAAARRSRRPSRSRQARGTVWRTHKAGAQVWMTGADPAAFVDIDASRRDFRRRIGSGEHAAREFGGSTAV